MSGPVPIYTFKGVHMHTSELAFFSTRDLIDELVRRQSFLGVVVHAVGETRGQGWAGNRDFQVRFNENLDAEAVSRLLSVVADGISPPRG
jgi:hypothetical protein